MHFLITILVTKGQGIHMYIDICVCKPNARHANIIWRCLSLDCLATKIVNINKVFVAIVMHTLKLLNHLVCLHTDD